MPYPLPLPEPLQPPVRALRIESAALALMPALVGAFLLRGLFPPPGPVPSALLFAGVMGALLFLANRRGLPVQSVARVAIPVIASYVAVGPLMMRHETPLTSLTGPWLIFAIVLGAPVAVMQFAVEVLARQLIRRTHDRLPLRVGVQVAATLAVWWLGTGGAPLGFAHIELALLSAVLLGAWLWSAIEGFMHRRGRHAFVRAVEAGKVPGLRVEGRPEGAVLVRIAPEVGYREAAADEVIGTVDSALRGLSSDNR